MGLIDRDYMNNKRSDTPFRPPPEKSVIGWLVTVLIFIAVMYAGFKGAHWLDDRARLKPKPISAALVPAPEKDAQAPATLPNLPQAQTESPEQQSRSVSIVTKCVTQGKVSYTDGACPAGAITSRVITRPEENRIAAVAVTVAANAPVDEPPPAAAQVNTGTRYAELKARCAALDARIKYLDDWARQPQTGQTQDAIRQQRNLARDEQFRIPCR